MRKIFVVVASIALCILVGFTAGQLQQSSIQTWYPTLIKSSLNPPNYVFPVAWGILYVLMGASIGLVLNSKSKDKGSLIILFSIQLAINFLWSILFFVMQSPLLGFICIIVLNAIIIWYTVKSYRHHKISSLLFMPYIVWIAFATYLNLSVLLLN